VSITEYIESAPLFDVVRYKDHAAMDAVAFVGTLRKHPYDARKMPFAHRYQGSSSVDHRGLDYRIQDCRRSCRRRVTAAGGRGRIGAIPGEDMG